MSTSPAEASRRRTERQLLTIAKQLPVPVLSEARREELRTALLAGVSPDGEDWRKTKQTDALPARRWERLLLVAAVLVAGAGIAAAAWRIKTRAPLALEPVEVAASAGGGKTRSVQGRRVGEQSAASAPIPDAAPTLLSPAPTPVRQPPPRSTRRMAAASTAARNSQANVEIAFARGWGALRTNDFEAAAQAFGQAIAEADDDGISEDASFWRCVALDRANRLPEAQEVLTRFLARYPKSDRAGEASVMLGWLLLRAGGVTAAEARFGSALGSPSERVRRSGRAGLAAAGRHHD